jgi:hypothetical protein
MKSLKWGRILGAGIGTQAAVLLVVTLVVTGYAFTLAFAAQGAPDQARIAEFAAYVGRSYAWILQILLTVPAAMWAVRRVENSLDLHGILVGLVVAVTGLAVGFSLSFRPIAEAVLTVGAGRLAAALVAHRRLKSAQT